MNEPPNNFDTVGDPPVEARIVAWVLGEASAFEAAELERLCEERPELLVFRRRMLALHGLLTEAETARPDEAWKLPPEKRKVLDGVLGAENVVSLDSQRERRIRHSGRRAILAIAACLILTLFITIFVSVDRIREIRATNGSLQAESRFARAAGPASTAEAELEALNRAVRDQEDKVEDRRKALTAITRSRGIIYRGTDSFYQSGVDEDKGARDALENYNGLQQQKLQLEKQVDTLLKYDSDQLMSYASGLELPDNVVKNLYPEYLEANRQLNKLKTEGLGNDHPSVRAAAQEAEAKKTQLDEGVVNLRANAQAQLDQANDRLKSIEAKQNAKDESIKRGLDAQDYVEAKENFESDQQVLQQLKLKQVEMQAAASLEKQRNAPTAVASPPAMHEERSSASQFGIDGLAKNKAGAANSSATAPAAPLPADNLDLKSSASLADAEPLEKNAVPRQLAGPVASGKPDADSDAAAPITEAEGVKASSLTLRGERPRLLPPPAGGPAGMPGLAGSGGGSFDRGSTADSFDAPPVASEPSPTLAPQTASKPDGARWAGNLNEWSSAEGAVVRPGTPPAEIVPGLRSGDQAVTRNSIDAILNNPDRPAEMPSLPGKDLPAMADEAGASTTALGTLPKSAPAQQPAASRFSSSAAPEEAPAVFGGAVVAGEHRFKGEPEARAGLEGNDFAKKSADKPAAGTDDIVYSDPDLGREDGAKREYQKMLELDTVNSAARRGVEQTETAKEDYYRAAYDHTRAGLQAQDEKKRESGGEGVPSASAPAEAAPVELATRERALNLDSIDEAIKRSEESLKRDPQNADARRELEKAKAVKSDYYRAAFDHTRAELLAQVDAAWELKGPEDEKVAANQSGRDKATLGELATDAAGSDQAATFADAENSDRFTEDQYQRFKMAVPSPANLQAMRQEKPQQPLGGNLAEAGSWLRNQEQSAAKSSASGYFYADNDGANPADEVTNFDIIREFKYPTEYQPEAENSASPDSSFPMTPATPAAFLGDDAEESARIDLASLMEEIPAADEPYSTFSLNISDASFQIAKAALEKGERPDPAGIKPEQFYNAVDYGDPAPAAGQPVAATIEQSAHPVLPGRNLVRVAVRTGSAGRGASQPLRLTLLVDQSGSMVREDRRAAMDKALGQLGGLLTASDTVTVIGFSRTPHLLAELKGDKAGNLAGLINTESSEGGTNLEEAMKLGREMAAKQQLAGAQNRVVLFTDGAANLGDANPDRLAAQVKAMRQQGLAFDVAGISATDLNDRTLAELARNGNGRYYVVGGGDGDSFARQLAGAFRPAAENVKVQVHFNPQRVSRYKLLGFEKDRLKTEDFRNDKVDAAELAAEETGVAIYQVEPVPGGQGELGEVSVRFRDTAGGAMVERSWTIPYDEKATAFDRATPSMQLAGLSLLAAEKLRGGPLGDAIDFKQLAASQALVKQFYGNSKRAGEMLQVIEQLK